MAENFVKLEHGVKFPLFDLLFIICKFINLEYWKNDSMYNLLIYEIGILVKWLKIL